MIFTEKFTRKNSVEKIEICKSKHEKIEHATNREMKGNTDLAETACLLQNLLELG
jgi:hypothetical protein